MTVPYGISTSRLHGPKTVAPSLPLALGTSHTIPGIGKALVWRFAVGTNSTGWNLKVTSKPAGAGEVMLEATGIPTNLYTLSWPWIYEADITDVSDVAGMHIQTSVSATLTQLRYEIMDWNP